MSATAGERSRKRSGAAVRRPDWAADDILAEIIRRILAAGEPQKIVLFGSRARGDAPLTATTICYWSSRLNFRVTSARPVIGAR